jgi:hypothetical protein
MHERHHGRHSRKGRSDEEVHCGKIRFGSLVKARHRALLDNARYKTKHYIYRCPRCAAWHMTHKPGDNAIDVAPNWKSVTDKGPGPKRGALSTSTLLVLRWFHGSIAALGEEDASQHFAMFHRIDRHLRRRGVF